MWRMLLILLILLLIRVIRAIICALLFTIIYYYLLSFTIIYYYLLLFTIIYYYLLLFTIIRYHCVCVICALLRAIIFFFCARRHGILIRTRVTYYFLEVPLLRTEEGPPLLTRVEDVSKEIRHRVLVESVKKRSQLSDRNLGILELGGIQQKSDVFLSPLPPLRSPDFLPDLPVWCSYQCLSARFGSGAVEKNVLNTRDPRFLTPGASLVLEVFNAPPYSRRAGTVAGHQLREGGTDAPRHVAPVQGAVLKTVSGLDVVEAGGRAGRSQFSDEIPPLLLANAF